MLQVEGKQGRGRVGPQAIAEAEAVDDVDALGAAYFVMGWAGGDLGKESVVPLWQRSWTPTRSGNRASRQGCYRISASRAVGGPLGRCVIVLRSGTQGMAEDRQHG